MDIPSWAFVNAGMALIASKPHPEPVTVEVPIKVPITHPKPVIVYDQIIELINEILPERNAFMNMLIELYI